MCAFFEKTVLPSTLTFITGFEDFISFQSYTTLFQNQVSSAQKGVLFPNQPHAC